MKLPRITVVTPSFNQGRYLEQTILSILSQKYPNLEYIIIDGGSTDDSKMIIEKYSDSLAYWQSCPDGGQANAIHQGFLKSTGDILAWVNSDDLLLKNALWVVGEYFARHPGSQMIVGNSLRIDQNSKLLFKKWAHPMIHYHSMVFWGCGFDQPASFWRRNIYFGAGGINPQLVCAFDYDLFLRISRISRIHRLRDFLACLRIYKDTKTSKLQDIFIKENRIIRESHGRYSSLFVYRFLLKAFHRGLHDSWQFWNSINDN